MSASPTLVAPLRLQLAVAVGAAAAGIAATRQPTLAVVAVAAVGFVVAALVRPNVATVAVIFLTFTNTPSVLANYHGVPQTAAALLPLLLCIPVAAALLRREPLVVPTALVLLGVYLVVMLAATTMSSDISLALVRLQTFVFEGLVLFTLLTNAVRTRRALNNVTWAIIAGGAFLGALTLFQYATHTFYSSYAGFAQVSQDYFFGLNPEPRLQGPIGDPNYYAQVLLIAMPLALLRAFAGSGRVRVAAIGATVLASAGIILTYSRGAVVALGLVFAIMVAIREVKVRHAALVVLAAALVVAVIPSYRDRVSSLASVTSATQAEGASAGEDQSVQGRSTEMRAAVLAFLDHPVLGVGPGQFPVHYQEYAGRVGGVVHSTVKFGPQKGATPERQAHDTYLGIAADLGAVGLAVFLSILAVSARGLWRVRKRCRWSDRELAAHATGYLLALAAYLAAGVFLSLAYERYLWMVLALAAVVVRLGRSERAADA